MVSIYYTRDLLEMSEKTLAAALETTSSNARALESALQGYLDVISQNKAELVTDEDAQVAGAAGSSRTAGRTAIAGGTGRACFIGKGRGDSNTKDAVTEMAEEGAGETERENRCTGDHQREAVYDMRLREQ